MNSGFSQTHASIDANIQARRDANELYALSIESPRCREILRELILGDLPPEKPKSTPIVPMTSEEAAAFGRSLMPYGEFQGDPVGDVPLARLEWYAEQSFAANLRRYLANERVQAEMEVTDEL